MTNMMQAKLKWCLVSSIEVSVIDICGKRKGDGQ